MKIVIVGTSHVGYEAAETALKHYPDATIDLFEKGGRASFMG